MFDTPPGSINQFLQSKSTRNNFSYSIKYTSSENSKEKYFNKSILNKNRNIITPKIELIQEDRLKTLYNDSKNNNIIKKITYVNKKVNIINRSSENFPRIILTKRGMKQYTGKTLDYSLENNYENYDYNNEIRRAKSGIYQIPQKETSHSKYNYRRKSVDKPIQESPSLPIFWENNLTINHNDNKGKNKSYKKLINIKNEYLINTKKEYRRGNNKQNNNDNNSYNYRLNTYSDNENRKILNYKSYKNIIKTENFPLDNNRSLNHFSVSNIYNQNSKNKNNHIYVSITNKKIGKKEIRDEYKKENNYLTKKIELNFDSNNKSVNITPRYINNDLSNETEKKKIITNKNHHVLYESKNIKNEKPNKNIVTININDNKENKNIKKTELKNYNKITKISKVVINKHIEINKNEKSNNIDKTISQNNKDSDKTKDNDIKNMGLDIINYNHKKDINKSLNNNEEKIKTIINKDIPPKDNIKKMIKNTNTNKIIKEKIDEIINGSIIGKLDKNKVGKKNKINKKNKAKYSNKEQNKNILEICKVTEVIFNETKKKINNEISQHNTTNSNIIIIINNSDKKKIKKIVPKNIKIKNKSLDNNLIAITSQNKNVENNKDLNIKTNGNNQKKNDNNNIIKNNTKIKRKHLKNINIINEKNNNNINKSNEDKINKENQATINNDKNKTIKDIPEIILKKDLDDINNKNINIRYKDNEEIEKEKELNNKDKKEDLKSNDGKIEENNKIFKDIKNNNDKENIKNKENENNEIIKENKNEIQLDSINNNENNEKVKETSKENIKSSEEQLNEEVQENDDFPKDSVEKIIPININSSDLSLSNSEIPRDKDEPISNNINLLKNENDSSFNDNNLLSNKDKEKPEKQSSINLNQEKIPDLNGNDYKTEIIHEIKPVIQHNIERKRPVFTLPPDKKRSTSQGKPFHLINKYYDENFILEDDEEEGFKKYIFNNEDSRSVSVDNNKENDNNIDNNINKNLAVNFEHNNDDEDLNLNNDNENEGVIKDINNENIKEDDLEIKFNAINSKINTNRNQEKNEINGNNNNNNDNIDNIDNIKENNDNKLKEKYNVNNEN